MFNAKVLKPTYYFKVGIFFSLLLCLFSCDLSDSQPSVDSLKTVPSDRPDYLSIALRADVEKLKLDARQSPTHKDNFILIVKFVVDIKIASKKIKAFTFC